jgi:hypothetical protein
MERKKMRDKDKEKWETNNKDKEMKTKNKDKEMRNKHKEMRETTR